MRNQRDPIISSVFRKMFTVQIVTMLTGMIGNVVDGMVTGNFLGVDAMAAFGFTSAASLAVAFAGGILSTGTSVVCGRSLGEGDLAKTRRCFSACFSAVVIVSAALAALLITLASPLADFAGASGNVAGLAADYIRGYGIACPALMIFSFLMPVMQMDGEMKRLMIAVVALTVGDIAGDLLNVLVFRGGMFGMALATAASYFLALLVLLPHFGRKDAIFRRPSPVFDGKIVRAMLKSGSPMALTQFSRLVLTFILNNYLADLGGGIAVAAQAIIMSVANLCMVPGSALGSATQVMAGVLNGEEDRAGMTRLIRTAMRYNLLINGACMLLFLLFAKPVTDMFCPHTVSWSGTLVTGFRFYTLCMIPYGLNLLFRSFCQGSGQTKRAHLITLCDGLLGPLVMALLLGTLFGVPAVWLCYVLGKGLTTAGMLLLFRRYGKGRSGLERVIPFSPSFGKSIEASFEHCLTERDPKEAAAVSARVRSFCEDHGSDSRTAFLIALAVEEAVGNVMEHGFQDGRPHSVELRVLKTKDGWILRVRDDCRLFDPKAYLDQYSDDDPSRNIGLKLLRGIASEITYVNALSLNNLTVRL